jgi:chromosomal replication initiation ATPase DnaA
MELSKIQYIDPLEIIDDILKKTYNISLNEICVKSRKKEIVRMRQIVQTILRRHTWWSLAEIGVAVGMRNHATVINSIKVIEDSEFVYKKTGKKQEVYSIYKEIESKFIDTMFI